MKRIRLGLSEWIVFIFSVTCLAIGSVAYASGCDDQNGNQHPGPRRSIEVTYTAERK